MMRGVASFGRPVNSTSQEGAKEAVSVHIITFVNLYFALHSAKQLASESASNRRLAPANGAGVVVPPVAPAVVPPDDGAGAGVVVVVAAPAGTQGNSSSSHDAPQQEYPTGLQSTSQAALHALTPRREPTEREEGSATHALTQLSKPARFTPPAPSSQHLGHRGSTAGAGVVVIVASAVVVMSTGPPMPQVVVH